VHALGPNNLLLKGSKLMNTEYVYGICVYTGHETKMMKNSAPARSKKSEVEVKMNNFIIVLILFQASVCIVAGTYYGIFFEVKG
jgi:magnesium-transporting ATPase (P-type)